MESVRECGFEPVIHIPSSGEVYGEVPPDIYIILGEAYLAADSSLQAKEFFEAAYTLLIGKTRGPRLAALILSIGREKVVKLLEQVK